MADEDGPDDGMLSALANMIREGGLKGEGPQDGPLPTPPSPDDDLAARLARYEDEVNE